MATKRPAKKRSVTKRPKGDFIAFILDAEKDGEMTLRFMSKENTEDLDAFFKAEGYMDIPEGDCMDILTLRERWERLTAEGHGKPPCEGVNRGY
jgi:hypothetical protein